MLKTLIMKATIIALVGSVSFVAHAIADTQRIDVPAGGLVAALETLAKQADVDIVYQDEQLKGLQTAGVSGDLSPRDAVMKLLEGTPLQLRTDETSGALLITTPLPSGEPAPSSTSATDENQPKPAAGADSAAVRENRSFWNRFRLARADTASERSENPNSSETQSTESDKKLGTSSGEGRVEEVIVTGSRIARPDLNRLQPTSVVSAESFEQRGYADAGQALQETPSFGIPSSSAMNQQNGVGVAQSFVDLYSLGSQRTLTLINGRRFVSSSSATPSNGNTSPGQQVDLNVIPTKLIDRIETVSVGGAPIYGADAIAGTVNIILKRDFEGLDFDAQTGVSERGDAWRHNFRALSGLNFADGRGNLTGVAEFHKSEGFFGKSRPVYMTDLGFLAPLERGPYRVVLTPNMRVGAISTSGIPLVDDVYFGPASGFDPSIVGVTTAGGQPLAWSPGSSALSPYDPGARTGNPIFWSGGDGVRNSEFGNLLSPQERVNVSLLGNFRMTDHVGMFAEAWFSRSRARNLINQPAGNSALFGSAGSAFGNFVVSVDNPFLSIADRTTIQEALDNYGASLPLGGAPVDPNWDGRHFYVSRYSTDLQNNGSSTDQVVMRGVLGVNGDFTVGERTYNWEAAANYGRSRDKSLAPAYVFQNLQNALNATTDGNGHIVCAGNPVAAPISTGSSNCAPLNIFGKGSPSAEALAYITHDAVARSINTQRNLIANLGGDLLRLPAGELKASVGFEYRRETADFEPDSFYIGGFGQSTVTPISGGYHTSEFYGEALVPIFGPFQDLPLLHQVDLEGAVRRVKNSIVGSSTTWTRGIRWSPITDVQFRGNKTRSIRAPAVTELFLPASSSSQFGPDPCDRNFVNRGNDPETRRRNCIAAGIDPDTFVSNVVNVSVQGINSGNQDLISETADSETFGVVLRPRFIPHFNLSVDYVDIHLTNAIQQLGLAALMSACYDAPDFPNTPSCSQFSRDAEGQIETFRSGYVNAALRDFRGVQFQADWSTHLPHNLGSIDLRASMLDTHKLRFQVGSASPVNRLGELSTVSTPRNRGVFNVDWHKGPLQWYWQGHYISPMRFSNSDLANSRDISGVGHWWVLNTTIGYDVTENFKTRLIINNVADKEPPYPAFAGGGGSFRGALSLYFPGFIGRTYLLSANYRFH